MTAVVGLRPPCEGADHLRQLKLNILQVGRPSKSGLPFDMCRKLTAFLGLRIGNYSSAAKNAVSALLLGGLAERKRCPWRTLASTVAPPSSCHPDRRGRRPRRPVFPACQSTEPPPPLVIPTERSERRDLGTNLHIQEISPLGRIRFLGRNDKGNPCLPHLALQNGGGKKEEPSKQLP